MDPQRNRGSELGLRYSGADPRSWHLLTAEEVAVRLGSHLTSGLPRVEVERRIAQYGYNRLAETGLTPPGKLFFAQFNDLLIIILIAAALISAAMGLLRGGGESRAELIDAAAIGAIVLLNAIMGFLQEYRAERAIAALKKLAAPRAHVIRDGAEQEIAAEQLVPGDIVALAAGDRVPADIRLTETHLLSADESSLTGESMPVNKTTDRLAPPGLSSPDALKPDSAPTPDIPLGDRINMAYSGTTITRGRAQGIVVATGPATEVGQVAEQVGVEKEKTPLQSELHRMGARIAYICLAVSLLVMATGLLRGYGWQIMFLTAVSLAVAAIPEGLPAAVTVSLALGVKRMVSRNALVRRLHAVETLGSTSFICTDKTGTLTVNKMRVERLVGQERNAPQAPQILTPAEAERHRHELRELLTAFALCNDVYLDRDGRTIGDPLEVGLMVAAEEMGVDPAHLRQSLPRVGEVPFEAERKAMSTVHQDREGFVVFVKGAPEVVAALSTPPPGPRWTEINHELTREGFRTIAFGLRRLPALAKPFTADAVEQNLTFLGLAALSDPPRAEVGEAIATCRQAGIRVAMVTGDHRLTAESIARSVGLLAAGARVLTGPELEALPDEELARVVEDVSVYARVSPLQKVKIVKALKQRGHIVAMTGDGVNDAPALKLADIGVAMGVTGTDVAKEAADMILLDDNFATIVGAVREGRTIFANLKKFIYFLLSCNISEVLSMLFAALAGFPILAPLQILWMNLVTDGAPALALGVDPMPEDLMKHPPRDPRQSVLSLPNILRVSLQGLVLTLGTVAAYIMAKTVGHRPDAEVRTIAATVLVLSQLLHAFNFRVGTRWYFSRALFGNGWLILALLASLALQAATIYVPYLNPVFRTVPLGLRALEVVLLCSLVPVLIINIINRSTKTKKPAA